MVTTGKRCGPAALLTLLMLLACGNGHAQQWSAQFDLLIEGQRRGHASIEVDGSGQYLEQQQLEVVQLGKRIRISRQTRISRDDQGRLTSIRVDEHAGGRRRSWQGKVNGAQMQWSSNQLRQQRRLRWDHSLLLADQQLHLLHTMHDSGEQRQASSFDPTAGAWREWQAQLVDTDGSRRRFRISESGWLPDDQLQVELDAQGRMLSQTVQRGGLSVHWQRCRVDCQRPVQQPLDMLQQQAVRSPYQIPKSALAGPIRYVLSRSDGAVPLLEITPEQDVVINGQQVVVSICHDCGRPTELSAQERQRYLSPNAWVRSDDEHVRRLARRAGGSLSNPEARMRKLEELVAEALPITDMLGYLDAATALKQGRGDCTETAVLLAAVARAQGIPARVVGGLVYSDRFSGRRDLFAPHYWVQAWIDDRWVSYDAGVNGFDATHIALGVGDGDPRQTLPRMRQLGLLRIDQMGQLPPRPRPSR